MPTATSRTTTRRFATLLTTLLALSLLVIPAASAQDYPPPPGSGTSATVTVQKSGVAPGDIQRITVDGLEPGSQVTIVVECPSTCEGFTINGGGTVAGDTISFTGTADPDGTIVFGIKVPRSAEDGTYAFTVTGTDADGEPFALQGTFAVDSSLPITGSQITRGAALAGIVIVAGAVMLVLARRRDREDQERHVAS